MPRWLELGAWLVVAIILFVFAIPWFLWEVETVIAGLPVWIWYHIGWLFLTTLVFWAFTRYGWGIGIPGLDESR